ncbi:MAG: class I SAM-dependent methyltransferase [Spirochaetales bacterium]|nr:class I SAM-dependent methyltransferase [Spirochaetales bacterium]
MNSGTLSARYERAAVDEVQNTLASAFSPGAKLLELGVGSGRDAAWMTARGFYVTGIDGSARMVEEACSLHPELSGKMSQGTLPDALDAFTPRSPGEGAFNGVYSIAVLMHLTPSDLRTTFRKVFDLLPPGGRFFFSVSLLRDDIDKNGLDKEGRSFTSWSREEWMELTRSCGFRELKTSINNDGLNRPGIKWLAALVEKDSLRLPE